ncbi:uncharacterized protein RCO7_00684 [Rhynchosporium graminicola]|uniref:Protein kinase domain-containing protein n=1 Tax=Rhynchosporium graminicola TaxID=2792576 RepID=A0A1E1LTN9_9HELO|nr:uncharacterized protein RCO7_00684 [Rhynchosporium commune]
MRQWTLEETSTIINFDLAPAHVSVASTITSPKGPKHHLHISAQQQPYFFRMSSGRESDIARLEQLLREADQRVEWERRRAEEAEARAQLEEEKTKPTTFEEYLYAYHKFLSKPLYIQTDKSLSTQGSITSPKNKLCPTFDNNEEVQQSLQDLRILSKGLDPRSNPKPRNADQICLKEDELYTLYYHLAEPNIEAEAQDESQDEADILLCRTARNHALETSSRAVINHEAILRQIPAEEKAMTPPSSVFHARIHAFKRSPIILRARKPRTARNSCGSADVTIHGDPQSPSGSSDEASNFDTPSKPWGRTHQSGNGQLRSSKSSQVVKEGDVRHQRYCTRIYPDSGCEPLRKQGARGTLFRLTLKSHGYTFVAKGTMTAFEAKLKHEGLVYRHLDKVQGELVPVYLGNISLGGEQARKDLVLAMGRDIAMETSEAVTKLLNCGMEHHDIRPPNVLWNPETRNVVLVDFERSEIIKQDSVLQETSPNRKRKHLHVAPRVSYRGLSDGLFIDPSKCLDWGEPMFKCR